MRPRCTPLLALPLLLTIGTAQAEPTASPERPGPGSKRLGFMVSELVPLPHPMRAIRQDPQRFGVLALMLVAMLTFATGGARAETEARAPVILPAEDRAHLLEEMRDFLVYTTATLDAALARDMARVQRLAEQVHPPLARARRLAIDDPAPALPRVAQGRARDARDGRDPGRFERMRRNLPQPFRLMIRQMREGIAEIGHDAVARNDPFHTLRQLHQVQTICVACHAAYRLEAGDPSTKQPSVAGEGGR